MQLTNHRKLHSYQPLVRCDWWLGPAVHQAKQGLRHWPDRAENDFAIVPAVARAVPLRTVNGRLRGWLGPAILDRLLPGGQTNRG